MASHQEGGGGVRLRRLRLRNTLMMVAGVVSEKPYVGSV